MRNIIVNSMIETTILTLIWGLVIGLLVSAPMGPTGILVVQRTLNKGWLPGFLTGLGAILSDVTYALITLFALKLVVNVIQEYEVALQIIGGFFIACYSYFLWTSNPVEVMANNNSQSVAPLMQNRHRLRITGILKYFFTGFALTISNPMIVFFFLALFARTNFLFETGPDTWWLYILGITAIIGGALAWWTLITWTVNKIRNRFRVKTIRNINRSIALLMIGIALFGIGNGFYILVTQ